MKRAESTHRCVCSATTNGRNVSVFRRTLRSRHAAFTLIEIMIALGLISLMLAGMWSFFGIYQRILESSQTRVFESQLARTIQDQISYDLQHVFIPTIESDQEQRQDDDALLLQTDVKDAYSNSFGTLSELPKYGFDDEKRLPLGEVVFEISNSRWLASEIRFYGNAYGLVIERFVAPHQKVHRPGVRRDEQGQELDYVLDRARESWDRVVYCFLESKEAIKQGLPAGLLRIEMNGELLRWAQHHRNSGLYNLLRELRPELFEGLEPDPLLNSQEPELESTQEEDILDPNARFMIDRQLVQLEKQLDVVPEVSRFRLRYFDGVHWSDAWDAQQEKQMPVAIEVSFQLQTPPLRNEFERLEDNEAADGYSDTPTDPETELQNLIDPMELDGEIRSAQTLDLEPPNRFLIFIRPPEESVETPEPMELLP